ncbi:bifunctional protein FolD 2 [Selaginella moellendorffii]|uniref:bifunctional protein FolD 2 n=1 Tax=Selaginella moellendorffii TaxID=88036 RepID=UPI000D1CD7F7|nr:bifunctional protein FolD 2 [Selaginella moellendorffii]|eukprot:XP_024523141.1 bifunctional protein FolD 2 [Selaginella moellendorffii]
MVATLVYSAIHLLFRVIVAPDRSIHEELAGKETGSVWMAAAKALNPLPRGEGGVGMGASIRSGASLAATGYIPRSLRSQQCSSARFRMQLLAPTRNLGLSSNLQQQHHPLEFASSGKKQGSLFLVPSTGDNWKARSDLLPCRAIAEEEQMADAKEADTAARIDGKAISQAIRDEVAQEVARMKSALGKVPGLAVILVGSRKDSLLYVTSKEKACEQAGIRSYSVNLPDTATEAEILEHVHKFNRDPDVHGILVQLPLPKHVREQEILGAVSMDKDVDGFHPTNIGRLAMQGRQPLFIPCTPRGCIELLLRTGVQISGKHAVVIGRSNIVGTPAAMLLQRHNATVTVVHSYTPDPAAVTRTADIVIAAAGVAHLVRKDWLKPGAVVIDVGINPIEDPSAKKGHRTVGDVHFKEACSVASAITPVPGGVGPMTIAMLLQNTVESAKRAYEFNGT